MALSAASPLPLLRLPSASSTPQANPSEGDTTIHGLSLKSDAAKIRKFLGICPQHDILYDELTSVEHLWLYGALKGIDPAALAETLTKLIEHVKLTRVRNKQAGTYSSGMKRHLSQWNCCLLSAMDDSTVEMTPA